MTFTAPPCRRRTDEPHRLVLETLSTVPADRKCFRMINGVMVERKVQDVIPTLQTNHEGLKKVLDELAKQVKAKHDEFSSWKVSSSIPQGLGRTLFFP